MSRCCCLAALLAPLWRSAAFREISFEFERTSLSADEEQSASSRAKVSIHSSESAEAEACVVEQFRATSFRTQHFDFANSSGGLETLADDTIDTALCGCIATTKANQQCPYLHVRYDSWGALLKKFQGELEQNESMMASLQALSTSSSLPVCCKLISAPSSDALPTGYVSTPVQLCGRIPDSHPCPASGLCASSCCCRSTSLQQCMPPGSCVAAGHSCWENSPQELSNLKLVKSELSEMTSTQTDLDMIAKDAEGAFHDRKTPAYFSPAVSAFESLGVTPRPGRMKACTRSSIRASNWGFAYVNAGVATNLALPDPSLIGFHWSVRPSAQVDATETVDYTPFQCSEKVDRLDASFFMTRALTSARWIFFLLAVPQESGPPVLELRTSEGPGEDADRTRIWEQDLSGAAEYALWAGGWQTRSVNGKDVIVLDDESLRWEMDLVTIALKDPLLRRQRQAVRDVLVQAFDRDAESVKICFGPRTLLALIQTYAESWARLSSEEDALCPEMLTTEGRKALYPTVSWETEERYAMESATEAHDRRFVEVAAGAAEATQMDVRYHNTGGCSTWTDEGYFEGVRVPMAFWSRYWIRADTPENCALRCAQTDGCELWNIRVRMGRNKCYLMHSRNVLRFIHEEGAYSGPPCRSVPAVDGAQLARLGLVNENSVLRDWWFHLVAIEEKSRARAERFPVLDKSKSKVDLFISPAMPSHEDTQGLDRLHVISTPEAAAVPGVPRILVNKATAKQEWAMTPGTGVFDTTFPAAAVLTDEGLWLLDVSQCDLQSGGCKEQVWMPATFDNKAPSDFKLQNQEVTSVDGMELLKATGGTDTLRTPLRTGAYTIPVGAVVTDYKETDKSEWTKVSIEDQVKTRMRSKLIVKKVAFEKRLEYSAHAQAWQLKRHWPLPGKWMNGETPIESGSLLRTLTVRGSVHVNKLWLTDYNDAQSISLKMSVPAWTPGKRAKLGLLPEGATLKLTGTVNYRKPKDCEDINMLQIYGGVMPPTIREYLVDLSELRKHYDGVVSTAMKGVFGEELKKDWTKTSGLKYRMSKKREDYDGSMEAPWGTTVKGIDRDDGWLEVSTPKGMRYLPFEEVHKTVLALQAASDECPTVVSVDFSVALSKNQLAMMSQEELRKVLDIAVDMDVEYVLPKVPRAEISVRYSTDKVRCLGVDAAGQPGRICFGDDMVAQNWFEALKLPFARRGETSPRVQSVLDLRSWSFIPAVPVGDSHTEASIRYLMMLGLARVTSADSLQYKVKHRDGPNPVISLEQQVEANGGRVVERKLEGCTWPGGAALTTTLGKYAWIWVDSAERLCKDCWTGTSKEKTMLGEPAFRANSDFTSKNANDVWCHSNVLPSWCLLDARRVLWVEAKGAWKMLPLEQVVRVAHRCKDDMPAMFKKVLVLAEAQGVEKSVGWLYKAVEATGLHALMVKKKKMVGDYMHYHGWAQFIGYNFQNYYQWIRGDLNGQSSVITSMLGGDPTLGNPVWNAVGQSDVVQHLDHFLVDNLGFVNTDFGLFGVFNQVMCVANQAAAVFDMYNKAVAVNKKSDRINLCEESVAISNLVITNYGTIATIIFNLCWMIPAWLGGAAVAGPVGLVVGILGSIMAVVLKYFAISGIYCWIKFTFLNNYWMDQCVSCMDWIKENPNATLREHGDTFIPVKDRHTGRPYGGWKNRVIRNLMQCDAVGSMTDEDFLEWLEANEDNSEAQKYLAQLGHIVVKGIRKFCEFVNQQWNSVSAYRISIDTCTGYIHQVSFGYRGTLDRLCDELDRSSLSKRVVKGTRKLWLSAKPTFAGSRYGPVAERAKIQSDEDRKWRSCMSQISETLKAAEDGPGAPDEVLTSLEGMSSMAFHQATSFQDSTQLLAYGPTAQSAP